jgi:hypothetical protein
MSIYDSDAIVVRPDGTLAVGYDEIRRFYIALCKDRPHFAPGRHSRPLINGSIAMTSSTLSDGTVTVEVAARQEDGSWLWVIDHPNIGRAPA